MEKRTILTLLFFLCSFQVNAQIPPPQEVWKTGEITAAVKCLAFPDQQYALFLPSSYDAGKKWPILYAYDAGGRGRYPVELFREAAERYGYIVAGSYNVRNGPWDRIIQAMAALWNDTQARLAIDLKRIYAAGFSGGARAASMLPRVTGHQIAGIIGCGAGWASGVKPEEISPAYFLGVVGNRDFNLIELMALQNRLSELEFPHRILTFQGEHAWPPSEICTQAVEWMEITAMSRKQRPVDREFIQKIYSGETAQVQALLSEGDRVTAVSQMETIKEIFTGLIDTKEFNREIDLIRESTDYQKAKSDSEYRFKEELQIVTLNRNLIKALDSVPPVRKESERLFSEYRVDRFFSDITKADSQDRRDRAYRILTSLLLDLRRQGGMYLEKKNAPKSIFFLSAAAGLSSHHTTLRPYLHYLLALAHALENNRDRTLENLGLAVKYGMTDPRVLEKEPLLSFVRNTPEYQSLLASLKK